jgi:AAA domain, putative AbiEii toxin, Type IV TA system
LGFITSKQPTIYAIALFFDFVELTLIRLIRLKIRIDFALFERIPFTEEDRIRIFYHYSSVAKQTHFNHLNNLQTICIQDHSGNVKIFENGNSESIIDQREIGWFNLNAASVEQPEQIQVGGKIKPDGQEIISILDDLKTGDREDLFHEIEQNLTCYIPSIEKLSLRISEPGKKSLQVREKGIEKPFPVAELSEGTKLILMILTILYQDNPPKLILLEDIDRGLHPRLF